MNHSPIFEKTMKIVERIAELAGEYYGLSVLSHLAMNTPIIFNGQELNQFGEKNNYKELIASYARKKEMCGKEFTENIRKICSELAEMALNDLICVIKSAPIQSFLMAVSMLQQNLILTTVALSWYQDYLDKKVPEKNQNKFVNSLNESLSNMARYNTPKEVGVIYKIFESHLSIEKLTLQMLVEITHDHLMDENFEDGILDIRILTNKMRALYHLLMLREHASNEIGCLKKLIVSSDGKIEVEAIDQIDDFYNHYGELFTSWVSRKNDKIIEPIFIEKLNPVCKKYTGFTINEIEKLSEHILGKYMPNNILLATKEDFFYEIKKLSGKTDEETEALMKFLMRSMIIENNYIGIFSDRPYRPLRKSILIIEDNFIITSAIMLLFSIKGIVIDIFDDRIQEADFSSEIKNILNEINEKFEQDVANNIKKDLTPYVYHNLDKIGSNPPYLIPPGQIDILVLYNKKLFVIECKNYPLKYTPQAIGNELNKLRKSVSKKLEKKLTFVNDHKEVIIELLGASNEDCDFNQKPLGVIVTNNFSVGEALDDLVFPVVNVGNIVSWLQSLDVYPE
ncbi:nuclease-related domain-containing protein [Pectinatus frisingensis]|uniref:nuclease-related domain-containing protein n=1 Tax=Pectinatus frisingensis TaxID=865 RepID=UPI0018C7D647|nr:nuclease-related domain-containing protein [Pectinatus frisingensis]